LVRDAIATYEMTLVTPSRFDRYLQGQRATEAELEAQVHKHRHQSEAGVEIAVDTA
jgi:cytochrome c peroxidase